MSADDNHFDGPTTTNIDGQTVPLGDCDNLNQLYKHWDNQHTFMLSYGLKPHSTQDCEEAKAIAYAMMDQGSGSQKWHDKRKAEGKDE